VKLDDKSKTRKVPKHPKDALRKQLLSSQFVSKLHMFVSGSNNSGTCATIISDSSNCQTSDTNSVDSSNFSNCNIDYNTNNRITSNSIVAMSNNNLNNGIISCSDKSFNENTNALDSRSISERNHVNNATSPGLEIDKRVSSKNPITKKELDASYNLLCLSHPRFRFFNSTNHNRQLEHANDKAPDVNKYIQQDGSNLNIKESSAILRQSNDVHGDFQKVPSSQGSEISCLKNNAAEKRKKKKLNVDNDNLIKKKKGKRKLNTPNTTKQHESMDNRKDDPENSSVRKRKLNVNYSVKDVFKLFAVIEECDKKKKKQLNELTGQKEILTKTLREYHFTFLLKFSNNVCSTCRANYEDT